jgi:hypothetical protein
MIERTYSKHITEYADEHARVALLHQEPAPVGDNVIPISGR